MPRPSRRSRSESRIGSPSTVARIRSTVRGAAAAGGARAAPARPAESATEAAKSDAASAPRARAERRLTRADASIAIAMPESSSSEAGERRSRIRVGLAQIDSRLGDLDWNLAHHLEWIENA